MAELPAWLIAKVDQVIAAVEDQAPPTLTGAADIVMLWLSEPGPNATKAEHMKWERTCDHCGKDCQTAGFYTGSTSRTLANGTPAIVMFGICEDCNWEVD